MAKSYYDNMPGVVSARLVFSGIMVILIVALVLGASILINKGPIMPLLGVIGASTTISYSGSTTIPAAPIVVEATCSASSNTFLCQYPYFNYTTGVYTVAIRQNSGYNWTFVSIDFVPSNAVYSHGVPELSWFASRSTVNVTGGLQSGVTKYVNIPITSGPVAVGTNITGSIWAKYQLQVGGGVEPSYANISVASIVVKR